MLLNMQSYNIDKLIPNFDFILGLFLLVFQLNRYAGSATIMSMEIEIGTQSSNSSRVCSFLQKYLWEKHKFTSLAIV